MRGMVRGRGDERRRKEAVRGKNMEWSGVVSGMRGVGDEWAD